MLPHEHSWGPIGQTGRDGRKMVKAEDLPVAIQSLIDLVDERAETLGQQLRNYDLLYFAFDEVNRTTEEEEILPQPPSPSVGTVLPDETVEHRNAQGQLHRLDGPAREWADGTKEWYVNGLRHRLDGPAFEGANGTKGWYQNGIPHRLDGPAREGADGFRSWWVNGLRHRLDGPAFEGADGTKGWFQNGLRHRLDGPAFEGADGSREWWVNGLRQPNKEGE